MRVFHLGSSVGAESPPQWLRGERLVAVGIVGKSPLRNSNKAAPLLTRVQQDENLIECHWDERAGVVYMHLCSAFDTRLLTRLVSQLGAESVDDACTDAVELARRRGDWLVAAGDLATETARSLFLLLNICHVVVVSIPGTVFDLSYVHLFKALDTLRTELGGALAERVAATGVAGEWGVHGRPCCPRVLFHLERAPRQLRRDPGALKTLRHCLEDQIYLILRKARVITNVCAKSLFAIPKNEEFVYMEAGACGGGARDLSRLVRGLVARCGGAVDLETRENFGGLKQFIQAHIDQALTTGFDDNVGKFASSSSYFEVPSAATWRLAVGALTSFCLGPRETSGPWRTLWEALSTDVRFSAARCAKVAPIAHAAYTEGLPSHYSTQHHLQKVGVAVNVFDTMARGPLCATERRKLEDACAAVWSRRRVCEAPSLTGHPCREAEHTSEDGDDLSHSSGVRYVCACNCGRTKCTREDPFTVRRANFEFYKSAAAECRACSTLEVHDYPVFQPSTSTFREASLKSNGGGAETGEAETEAYSGTPSPAEALSPGDQSDDASAPPRHLELLVSHTNKDMGVTRQASTTEYLPGMLHTDSPAGLLPAFSSWSLVCLGASSLYSHSLGLPDHLHPGFLPHTNFLLPWDCAVRMEQVHAWRAAQAASRGRGAKPPAPHQLTVKIFLGFEYECPRGHRFMSSTRGVVNGGPGKEIGAELAGSDMPLYMHCPCRGGKTMLAQLMRVHVVSPKAPVHITLDPRVQPTAGGAIFIPGGPPARLSGSAYWLLRLPYIYCDERGPLQRPNTPLAPHQAGRLLAGCVGVTE